MKYYTHIPRRRQPNDLARDWSRWRRVSLTTTRWSDIGLISFPAWRINILKHSSNNWSPPSSSGYVYEKRTGLLIVVHTVRVSARMGPERAFRILRGRDMGQRQDCRIQVLNHLGSLASFHIRHDGPCCKHQPIQHSNQWKVATAERRRVLPLEGKLPQESFRFDPALEGICMNKFYSHYIALFQRNCMWSGSTLSKDGGIFVDSELNDINCYWLQFEPAPLMNHLVLALIFFLVFVIGFSSNTLVLYIMAA